MRLQALVLICARCPVEMQVKTILNRIEKHPSFVYEAVGLVDGPRLRLEVKVRARANARAKCSGCAVKVESVPWATGKHRLTRSDAWFLAWWAKRLSWQEVAEVFPTSWDTVFGAVCMAVEWGRAHHDLGGIEALGTSSTPGSERVSSMGNSGRRSGGPR